MSLMLIVLLVLVLLLFGAGFAFKFLWWVAIILFVAWAISAIRFKGR